MNLSPSAALCDAIEVGAYQLGTTLTQEDVYREFSLGAKLAAEELKGLIADAYTLAAKRQQSSITGYPFVVTDRTIEARRGSEEFSPYFFLLFGHVLSEASGTSSSARDFRKYFEDFVCWCMSKPGYSTFVLSIPREERGLPKSLKPALKQIAKSFGEHHAELNEDKITSDDNDLGVDVLAAQLIADESRGGKPVFLIQCATGAITNLDTKLEQKANLFPGVWDFAFHQNLKIRCVATPDDLITLGKTHWDRLCANGWVLDRMRLTRLAHFGAENSPAQKGLIELWRNQKKEVQGHDWRSMLKS